MDKYEAIEKINKIADRHKDFEKLSAEVLRKTREFNGKYGIEVEGVILGPNEYITCMAYLLDAGRAATPELVRIYGFPVKVCATNGTIDIIIPKKSVEALVTLIKKELS